MSRFLLILAVVVACGGGTPEGFVSRTTLTPWPLTVESGQLSCVEGSAVTFLTNEYMTYAVNGTARTHFHDLPTIDELLVEGSNIGPLIDKGLELCA